MALALASSSSVTAVAKVFADLLPMVFHTVGQIEAE